MLELCATICKPFWSICKPQITTVELEPHCYIELPSMADFDWSCFKGCWAKIHCPFIKTNFIVHLFQPSTVRKSPFQHCSSNLVRFRISLFSKSCYALERSCHAEYNETWIVKNGWVLRELCWNEIWLLNFILLDASLLVQISVNDC